MVRSLKGLLLIRLRMLLLLMLAKRLLISMKVLRLLKSTLSPLLHRTRVNHSLCSCLQVQARNQMWTLR